MPTTCRSDDVFERAIEQALESGSDLGLRLALTVMQNEYRRLQRRAELLEGTLRRASAELVRIRDVSSELERL